MQKLNQQLLLYKSSLNSWNLRTTEREHEARRGLLLSVKAAIAPFLIRTSKGSPDPPKQMNFSEICQPQNFHYRFWYSKQTFLVKKIERVAIYFSEDKLRHTFENKGLQILPSNWRVRAWISIFNLMIWLWKNVLDLLASHLRFADHTWESIWQTSISGGSNGPNGPNTDFQIIPRNNMWYLEQETCQK